MDQIESLGSFTGWALVEVMGHRKYAGFVSVIDLVGPAFMLAVQVPAYSTRQVRGKYEPAPTPDDPGRTAWVAREHQDQHVAFRVLLHPQAVFAITPCTELEVLDELETGTYHQGPTAPTSTVGDAVHDPADEF